MSQVSDCSPCCTTPPAVQVPGPSGANGSDGTNGQNAYTVTTGNFTIPAEDADVAVSLANTGWMVVGQNVIAGDGTHFGNFTVASISNSTSASLTFLNLPGDSTPGTVLASGSRVSVSGPPNPAAIPVPIAEGGTNAITKAAAQTNLGLGQNPLVANSAGLTQVITNSYVEVGTCDVTVASPGAYLLIASAIVTMVGVTFASSRIISLKIRNITQGVDIAVGAFPTGALTTTTLPAFLLSVPIVVDSTANASDHYQLMVTIDTVNSAGVLSATEGRLSATPLRLN